MGLIITLALGLFIAVGALISSLSKDNKNIVQASVSLALGTLGTLAVVELIPEAVEHLGSGKWLTILIGAAAGFAFLTVLDKFLPDHDGGEEHGGHGHGHSHGHDHAKKNAAHIGVISAIAVTLHNIIEGMAVYSICRESAAAGLMVALGVGLHNIPMGIVIYSTLRDQKKERNAMILLSSVSTFIGGLLMSLLWGGISEAAIGVLIAVTLGMILYIVCMELIPVVFSEKQWKISVPFILLGAVIILISTLFE